MGLSIIAACLLSEKKTEDLIENDTNYLDIGGTLVELSTKSPHLQLEYSFLEWVEIDKIEWSASHSKDATTESAHLQIFAQGQKGHGFFTANDFTPAFWQKIASVCGKDASLYIKVPDADNQDHFAAIKPTIDSPSYVSELMNTNFFGNTIFNINTKQYLANNQNDFQLLTFSPNEPITPCFLFNEQLSKNQKLRLDIDNLSNDSLHALVKTESGAVYRHCFENPLSFNLSKILEQHVESSTIYLCVGSPQSPSRRLSILNISKDNVLHAVQSDLLLKTTGINIDSIKTPSITYKNEDLNFVWGDIRLAFTKNIAGDFFAKKRISRSQWNTARLNTPNLVLGKSFYMDSLSFDFSMERYDADTVNKVLLRDVTKEEVAEGLQKMFPDSLAIPPLDQEERIIRLDSIKNDQLGKAIISLEIEVFNDAPKAKQGKFQFHWGNIDTTLIQENKSGAFSQSVEVSLAKFQNTFKKEPVLTSSKSGVVNSFECKVLHYRKGIIISDSKMICNIKEAKTFSNSIKKIASLNNAQPGDKILLNSFSSVQINENEILRLEIILKKNSVADEAVSIDDKNLFLEWGDLRLKTTPLGDSSPKKRTHDQVLDKDKLEQIIREESYLNKYGRKERIVNAEWFLNDDIYRPSECKTEKWRDCFLKQISDSKSGDFISLFMRTSNGAGIISQFYIDFASSDALLGYGNTQFDSLLFKYSKYAVSKISLPKYQYEFNWGNSVVPLELVGNPRVYGGKISIRKEALKDILQDRIEINSSDGEVITVDHAYLILYKARTEKRPRKFYHYDFDCINKDCAFADEQVAEVLDDLEGSVYSVRVFVDQHVPAEEGVKVSFIDFIIEDDSDAWIPQKWISSQYPTDLFEFQFVYQNKEKTLVKFDQENEKYKWLLDKYKNDTSVELIDMPGFKTTQRAIYTKYDFGEDPNIRNTQVLSKNYTNGFTLFEYHDINSKKINLYWKGYPSLTGAQSYCKDDFVCADGGLELTVDNQVINILRGDLVIIPENSNGYKFVFDDIDAVEISEVLEDLPPYTSLLFENILVEGDKGESLRLPINFAYHLE